MNARMNVSVSVCLLSLGVAGCAFSPANQAGSSGGGSGNALVDAGAGSGGTTMVRTGGSNGSSGGAGAGPIGSGSGGLGSSGSTGGVGSGGFSGSSGGAVGSGGASVFGTTQCSDGLDNDGDGKVDLLDLECVSPLDNDESSFATGIPGDNVDACKQDCFFDGNSGMGDDGCNVDLKCDPANSGAGSAASCPYDPAAHNCPTTQSPKCVQNCGAVTPNGCDCFGCCTVPGVSHPVRLDSTCTAAHFNDPTKCPTCTQQTSCLKPCGPCQLCLGKTTLDPSCYPADGGTSTSDGGTSTSDGGSDPSDAGTTTPDGGGASDAHTPTPTPICPVGQTVCGTTPSLCGNGTICVTGCCVPWIF